MYNHFKLVERYGICERSFISIEIIRSHEIIILLSVHIVAPSVLSLYMKKSKNTETMKTFSNWLKSMGYMNVLSYL